MTPLWHGCAGCLNAGRIVAPPGVVVSHGTCTRCAAEMYLDCIIARLRGPEYMSAALREETARLAELAKKWLWESEDDSPAQAPAIAATESDDADAGARRAFQAAR